MVLALGGCGNKSSEKAPASVTIPAPAAKAAAVPPPPVPDLPETVKIDSPDFGVLSIKIPSGGQTDIAKPVPGNPAVTGAIKFASGLLTELRVTTLGPADLTPDFADDAALKRQVEKWGETLKGKTTEAELAPVLFESEPVRGYYVTATDANPAPGQPKFLVNGFFRASTGAFMLGGLSNDAPGAIAEVLAVAKTAQWESKPAPADAAKPDEPQPSGK
jgi:hypothetical protein